MYRVDELSGTLDSSEISRNLAGEVPIPEALYLNVSRYSGLGVLAFGKTVSFDSLLGGIEDGVTTILEFFSFNSKTGEFGGGVIDI